MDQIALVTGSSRGIGAATAALLARSGWAVCINYVERRDKAEQLAAQLEREGCRVMYAQADVSRQEDVQRMFTRIEARFGPVTLLVNNAGIARQQQFQDITPESWRRIFAVNLDGCFHTIQAALPHMLHAHAGCIVNVSSIWGSHGASCESAYAATKHAIIGLSRSLAAELAPTGIRVNAVAPGVIDTDMVKALGQETLDSLAREQIPLGRLGRPAEIAEAVLYLSRAQYVTGQVLGVDGGFIL